MHMLLPFQNVHQDLQEAVDDQELLKAQVAEYASQVSRIEDLLAQKVNINSTVYLLCIYCCFSHVLSTGDMKPLWQ